MQAQPIAAPQPRTRAISAAPSVPLGDLAAIYRANHATVWRVVRSLGVPLRLVDDATQDVFVVVHRRLHTYDGTVPLRRWILGIARNVGRRCRDKAARTDSRTDALDATSRTSRVPEPDDAVAHQEAARFVDTFLASLRPDKRGVFALVDIEGFSAVEAAEILDIKLNTVYSRLRVARQRFESAVARHRRRSLTWTP